MHLRILWCVDTYGFADLILVKSEYRDCALASIGANSKDVGSKKAKAGLSASCKDARL